jgi:hypothetical protein
MRTLLLSVTTLALTIPLVWSQEVASPEEVPAIEPEVVELITAWAEAHAQVSAFRVRIMDTLDEVWDDGQKIQMAHVRTATVERPSHLRVESSGDEGQRLVVYDGETISIADHDLGVYGQLPFEGTVDEMMDMLVEEYDVSTPLADLLSERPADVLLGGVEEAIVVGSGLVGETQCTQIACRQEAIDWQAWFSGSETPQLRRLVVTYRDLPGEPQYSMQVLEFEATAPEEGAFAFDPGDLTQIPFRPIEASPEAEASDAL